MLGEQGELTEAAPVLVVAHEVATGTALGRVVAATRDRRAITAGWGDAVAAIGARGRLAAVLADCTGVEAGALTAILPELAAASELVPTALVVGFPAAQLETVAGQLIGGDAVLLCDPTPLDWATALALASPRGALTIHDVSPEDDRYDRLSREVARIAETLSGLIEPDPATTQQRKSSDFVGEPPRDYGARAAEIDPAEVRRAIRARRLRDEAFAQGGLFEDPAWDMLLDLFAAELERRPVSVSSLCIAAAVPATTALRWISKLIAAGLLERKPDSHDRRRAFISLSGEASSAMRTYVASLRKAGLRLG